MKYLFIFLLFAACKNDNSFATQLMNDKKNTEDSIKLFGNYETYYLQKAKDEMHATHDSLKWQPLADSSTYFFGRGMAMKEKLKAIDFSLDSLSHMK